ncbi:MAG TPA: O-antigen ligase family protein [Rhizomicrobium sp.]|jgi:exopolysaccharide production protein ExoQ
MDEDRRFASLPVFDRDGIFAFALFTPMLFILQFGSYGALIFVLATLAFAVLRRRVLVAVVRERAFLLVFPAFAVISTMWSNVPYETLKHSLEFAVTILAAILLCAPKNPRSMLCGLFAAFALYTAVSFALGHRVDVGDDGARAFSGLNDSKNEEADVAAVGFVISLFLFFAGLWTRKFAQAAVAGPAALLQAYVIAAAMSAGAVAGAAASLAALLLLFTLRRLGAAARALVLTAGTLFGLCVGGVFELSGSTLVRSIAEMFGKDPTLTGRTYLWARARELIAEHPILGQGFGAFWQQGNLDAEGLWQFAQITTREGFNFHNTLYDVLVSLGAAGAVIFALSLLVGVARTAFGYIRQPGYVACLWLALAAYLFVRMPTECVGINEFYFSTVLLFAALGAARPLSRSAGMNWARPVRAGAPAMPTSHAAAYAMPMQRSDSPLRPARVRWFESPAD